MLEISQLAAGDSVKEIVIDKKSIAKVKKIGTNRFQITANKKKKGSAKLTIVLASGLTRKVKVIVK